MTSDYEPAPATRPQFRCEKHHRPCEQCPICRRLSHCPECGYCSLPDCKERGNAMA
jgi:hypothetical protein